jgi:hypothetical protein
MSSEGPDDWPLTIAHQEAQRTIDEQVQTLNDIDSKAIKILRVNVVLVGLVLTAVSFVANSSDSAGQLTDLINAYSIAGVGLLLLSTVLAALTYSVSTFRGGMSYEDVRQFVGMSEKYSDVQVLEGIVLSYAEWIRFNDTTNIRNSVYITATILTLVYALVALALSVVVATGGTIPLYWSAVVLITLLGYTALSGIVGQMQRLIRDR